jgi:predicted Zn-dependent peptidase
VEAERDVILEEILMSEDTPDDRVHRALAEALFPNHPLGREVLGDEAGISALRRDDIAGFHAGHYRPQQIVIAAAGALDPKDVMSRLDGFLTDIPASESRTRPSPDSDPVPVVVVERPTEQTHLALGWRTFGHDDPDRYALAVASQVLGGGPASRLFQEIREERGLAYTVYSAVSLYSDCGALSVYAATTPSRLDEVLSLIEAEIARLAEQGITERELEVARGYLVGSFLLGLEDSGSRMVRLGRGVVSRDEVVAVDEHVERLRTVTGPDVVRVVGRVLAGPRSLATLGPSLRSEPTAD